MLMNTPDTLVNYATQAYGEYVKTLCQQWMPLIFRSTSTAPETVDIKHIETVCGRLRNMLACVMIPSQVANNITLKLLRHVDKLLEFSSGIGELGLRREFKVDGRRILSNVASVLIHPAVTELNLQNLPLKKFHTNWQVINQFFCYSMSNLKLLKLVSVNRNYYPFVKIVKQSNFLSQNLQTLVVYRIDNGFLQEISDTLCNLKKIHASQCEIDEEGVDEFLKFTQLEDLTLVSTQMKLRYMTQLLEGLEENKDASETPVLKKFGCDRLTGRQLHFLVDNFQLESFHLCSFYIKGILGAPQNISPLQYSCHLRSLEIEQIPFSVLKTVLPAAGYQLSHLHLYPIGPVDMQVVAECCPMLVSLRMTCYRIDMVNDPDVLLPSFFNLKVLDLEFCDCPKLLTFLLKNCTSVKLLKVKSVRGNRVNIADVLQTNPLSHLEEFHWWSEGTSDVGMRILQHCQIMHSYFWQSKAIDSSGKPSFLRDSEIVRHMYAVRQE